MINDLMTLGPEKSLLHLSTMVEEGLESKLGSMTFDVKFRSEKKLGDGALRDTVPALTSC